MLEVPKIITKDWLSANQNCIFVFGDNLTRRGKKGAAVLRDLPNTYGFITKRYPSNKSEAFYNLYDYSRRFENEMIKLKYFINNNQDKIFLISKLGSGLANKHKIWEKIIYPGLKELATFKNVIFLFKQNYGGNKNV